MLSVLIINGCAVERIQLPDFDKATRSDEKITNPVAYPDLCPIPWASTSCWQRLDVYEDIAIGNLSIAQLNADIARDSDTAYDFILSSAKRQQQIGRIREEMLEQERRDHLLDNWFHRGLIALGLLGAVLK